jgi:hypothetical protein
MIIPSKHNGYTRDGVRRVYIDGGGGGGTPEKQTTVVDIPEWAKPYAKENLGKAQALSDTDYQAYGGERIAQFTPLQKQAFQSAGQQQVAEQIGAGSGLAGTAGLMGLTGSYQPGQFGSQMSQYMSPYMDAVIQSQMESAQRQADIAATQRGAQAVRAGAFGGSRQAIENAEAARALASQKGQIQATGMQSAYDRATDMYGREQALAEQSRQAGLGTALQSAQALGQLGQQQFGQQMDITGQQQQFGGIQRQATQDILSQQYQDFLNQQRAPYDQLAFMSSMIRGTPLGQTTTMYQPPASQTSQLIGLGTAAAGAYGAYQGAQPKAAAGGEVRSYAAGGIASLNQPELAAMAGGMSDQQLGQTAQMPSITELAKMTLAAEAQQRAQMRQQAMMQQAMAQQQPQGTVAEEQMAALEQGIGGLDVPDDLVGDASMAGGGIVAFQNRGAVPIVLPAGTPPEEVEIVRLQNPDQEVIVEGADQVPTAGIASLADGSDSRFQRGPVVAGVTDQPPAPLPPPVVEEKPPAIPGGPNYSGIMGLYGQERDRQLAAQEQLGIMRAADLAADRAALVEEEKLAREFGAEREKRNKAQEEKLAGSEKQNFNMTLIDMGLAMMAGQSPDALQNIAAGAQQGLKGYQSRLENIQNSREKLDESMARLAEIREEKLSAVGARKRELSSMERKELTNSKEAQEKIYSSFANEKIKLTKEQAEKASERNFAVWSAQQKGIAGSRTDAANLRLALGTEIKALRTQRDSGNGLNEAEAEQLAQLEREFRSLTNILGSRLGVEGGGTVAGSSTLPAGFKLD